jgi:hypothetical protein
MCKKSLTIIVALLFVLLINGNILGQTENSNSNSNAVTFGIIHSFNLTSVAGTFPSSDFSNSKTITSIVSPRYTFDLGMTVDYFIVDKLSVQFDLVYTYQGAHTVNKSSIYNEIGKLESKEYLTLATDYFKFPLTFNFYPKEKLYVNAGGYLASLVSAKTYDGWYDQREPIENMNILDYGIIAGMGFNTSYVKIGFQYSYGLNSFINDGKHDVHHSVFQLVTRWKFYSDIRSNKTK